MILTLHSVTKAGSLACGTYYYAVKAYKDSGLSTDWFMLPRSVVIPNKLPLNYNPTSYQQLEGDSLSFKSNIAVSLSISNYNIYPATDGWKMKIASFIALDQYTLDTGKVFYNGPVKNFIVHSSNNSYEDVSPSSVTTSTLSVIRCGDLTTNGEIAVIGDVETEVFDNGIYFDNLKFLNALGTYGELGK